MAKRPLQYIARVALPIYLWDIFPSVVLHHKFHTQLDYLVYANFSYPTINTENSLQMNFGAIFTFKITLVK